MDMDTREELKEATTLLESAKGPRARASLSSLVALLKAEIAPPAAAPSTPPAQASQPNESDNAVAAAPAAPAAVASTGVTSNASTSSTKEVAAAPVQTEVPVGILGPKTQGIKYMTFDSFAWDQGAYNSPKVSVYVPLDGVGAVKDRVKCSFTSRGFDLTVTDLNGKNYRLLNNNLDKDIIPNDSSFVVKRNKIILKLAKVKAEYGSYDHWTALTAKKIKPAGANKRDPSASIMDMMKDMYDDGDDTTKKLIGEAMMKRNQGKTPGSSFDDPSPSYGGGGGLGKGYGGSDDFGLGKGYGGLDDFGDDDLGTGNGGGSGEGGKKDDWGLGDDDDGDFGFGNKMPPPGSSDPVPAAVEEDEGSDGEGGVLPMEGGGGADPAVSGKEETGSVSATEAGKQTAAVDMNSLEALDD